MENWSDEWRAKMRCCLITDRGSCGGDLVETVASALRAGVRAVQLREKGAATRELHELAVRVRELTRKHNALLLINDRVDVALAVTADGVHLGWQSMPVAAVRRVGGPGVLPVSGRPLLIGRSVHNPDEAKQAIADGADYLFAGPVFETPSKAGLVSTLGLDGLRTIRALTGIPVIGLGGIDASNAALVIEAGADGIAVIRAILGAKSPRQAAATILAATRPHC